MSLASSMFALKYNKHMKIKFHHLVVLLFFLTSMPFQLASQTILEKLGAVKTDFIITSDTVVFEVFDQVIIQRGNAIHGALNEGGYGYGNQNYFLEFITREKIQKLKTYGPKNDFYRIELIDKNGNVLGRIYPYLHHVKVISNRVSPLLHTHVINLSEVPMVLLDKTTRINIEFFEQRWKYPKR